MEIANFTIGQRYTVSIEYAAHARERRRYYLLPCRSDYTANTTNARLQKGSNYRQIVFLGPLSIFFPGKRLVPPSTTRSFMSHIIIFYHICNSKVLPPNPRKIAAIKPTLLLIQDGWHVPSTYSKPTDSLQNASFEVHIPRLPSMNENRPLNADLNTDTQLIRDYASSLIDAGRTVIVIIQSYGGQVGTNALCGLGTKSTQSEGSSISSHMHGALLQCPMVVPWSVRKVQAFGHPRATCCRWPLTLPRMTVLLTVIPKLC